MRPRLALIPGDPNGIGPELVAKLLAEPATARRADVLVVGDAHVLALGRRQAGVSYALERRDRRAGAWRLDGTDDPATGGVAAAAGARGAGAADADRSRAAPHLPRYAWHPTETIAEDAVAVATESAAAGRSVLATLDLALELATEGIVDGVLFAPFNKAAMHAAGLGHDDELHYMAERLDARGTLSELNTLDGLWTSRVTSHVALRDVADAITPERVVAAVALIDSTLRRAGVARPRIAVAALNPHAGDGGNFGREEIDVIGPAVAEAASRQIAVDGPWPSDTVFLKARAGEVDAVVTMYHDQGQIALKLMGFDRGVTVQGGLPFPVATPAHGTAFDIAGQGVADVGATRAAFGVACDMIEHWDSDR